MGRAHPKADMWQAILLPQDSAETTNLRHMHCIHVLLPCSHHIELHRSCSCAHRLVTHCGGTLTLPVIKNSCRSVHSRQEAICILCGCCRIRILQHRSY